MPGFCASNCLATWFHHLFVRATLSNTYVDPYATRDRLGIAEDALEPPQPATSVAAVIDGQHDAT